MGASLDTWCDSEKPCGGETTGGVDAAPSNDTHCKTCSARDRERWASLVLHEPWRGWRALTVRHFTNTSGDAARSDSQDKREKAGKLKHHFTEHMKKIRLKAERTTTSFSK